jgi:polysaccharide pyruvyl transferase WcaK-like protein
VLAGNGPRRLRDAVDGADIVVAVGGSNLFDTGRGAGLSTLRLAQFALPGIAASSRGTSVQLIGHTLGPFDSRGGRRLARRLLSGADRVVVRDEHSVAVAGSFGVAARLASDVAFAVEPQRSERVSSLLDRTGLASRRFLAVVMRQHPYAGAAVDEVVLQEVVDAVRRVVIDGVVDDVLVVAHTIGPTRVEDDRPISSRLVAMLRRAIPDATIGHVEEDLEPAELAALYGDAAVVVAERLHAVILAVRGGTPAYALSYFTSKAGGVMQSCGLGEFWCDAREVSAPALADAIRRLADERRRDDVRRAADELAAEALAVFW